MWCIGHKGLTLQEVLIMAYMNILEEKGGVIRGQKVLIHGAAGGVDSVALKSKRLQRQRERS